MSGADISSRRHGGDMGGQSNKNSGRSCAGAAGRDINYYRNRRPQDVLDNGAGRGQKPAGRIELNNQGPGPFRARPADTLANKIIHRGINPPIDHDKVHVRPGGLFWLGRHGKTADDEGSKQPKFKRKES